MDTRNTITATELSECDREALHLIGHIQGDSGNCFFTTHPEGIIVAADERLLTDVPLFHFREKPVARAAADDSAGAPPAKRPASASSTPPPPLLSSRLEDWVPASLYQVLEDTTADMMKSRAQRAFRFYKDTSPETSTVYAISVSTTTSEYKVIGYEIERLHDREAVDTFFSTVTNLGRIMEFYANEAIVKTACDNVFNLLGCYDRGMVYQFNDDNSGNIIHEIKKEGIESSYMGMRFPSSDIPLVARQLYIKNGLRYIHSIEADDVPIISLQNQEVDLSQCRMRAVSKPHVIYLRNMGVTCSMSIAIVVESKLWGLLAFHGYSEPFKPSLHQRVACEAISAMLSVRIEALIKKEQSSRIIRLGDCLMNLHAEHSVIHNLFTWGEEMLGVLDCEVLVGHIIDCRDGESDSIVLGDAALKPKASFWTKLAAFPNREMLVLSTRDQITRKGFNLEECPASGIVAFREGRTQIVLGRKERSSDVKWAGNPDAPKLRIGGILCPRNSFDTFMEKARKEARAWSEQDLNVIKVLKDRICEHSHNWRMKLLETDIEATNQKYMNAIHRARDNYEFFAHMSHELRTPFHGVMGCLEILHDSLNDLSKKEVLDLLSTAQTSGHHMLNLLNDILNISKNKHLAHEISRDKVLYQSLAFEAIDGMKSLAVSRGTKLTFEIVPRDDKFVIETDRTKIIQIVSNTVNNAIKFTGEGNGIDVRFELISSIQETVQAWAVYVEKHAGVVFTMKEGEMLTDIPTVQESVKSLKKGEENEKWLFISVVDTGCGMKPNELAQMFAPYTQSSSGTNRSFQGTGLGLFICCSLCLQLGGFLACGSTSDIGTTFTIGIPVRLVLNDVADKKEESIDADALSQIVMTGPVLVVDDNLVNVKILKRALEVQFKQMEKSFGIITADGGADAIALFKEHKPSLCIVDYHMPEVDGIAATRCIRDYEKEKSLKPSYIMSYTADATEKTRVMLLASGTDEILSKPPPKGYIAKLARRLVTEDEKASSSGSPRSIK